uniref:Reverse transcriptase domain-containing protein n=1 Tax=Tanacetum cinerariifolium TaxID=118510 RepID=A0A6L2NAX3_TANCI|nr:reverse transcriptase domain-containing protein [Tanacetum cinerariifolium]
MKQNGVSDNALRLSLFQYSLTHYALLGMIAFKEIHPYFRRYDELLKYFPPSMVTKLRNEIMDFRQKLNESLFKAWERYKLSIDRCPNYNMLLVTQIDTFYNSLTLRHRDTINAAAGVTFMQKTPKECYDLTENMTTHHNHWDTSTCGGPHSYTECPAVDGYTQKAAYATTGNHNSRGNSYQPQGFESCMALADLGASINLMPLSVWKKLSLPDLTSTCMTLELATRSYAYPASIAKDVFVQVSNFIFPANFVAVDYDVDPCVPLILGSPFLWTARALVDVHGEDLILRDGDEQLIFHADITSKHPHKHGNESINMINFIDITCEDCFPKIDSLLKEFVDELAHLDPFPPGKEDTNFDFKADLREIEYLLNQDPSTESKIETIDPIIKKFTDEPALNYLPPSRVDDDDDDDLFDLKSYNDEWKKILYGDCYKEIDSEKDKNKDSKKK